uniref:Cysteine rich secreted protein n=1 Tax=Riptortus pedestris TaxID=329032 RepID=R4WHR2_RIPPE|nr:cysteine rich secreted protein [Riptortus pedestris]
MSRLVLAVGVLCLFSAVFAIQTESSEEVIETQVNKQWCSTTTYCNDGYRCCSKYTCCPLATLCCGGGQYCCSRANKLFELSTASQVSSAEQH